MNGAVCRHPDVAIQSSNQAIPDFARSPMRLTALGGGDHALELLRQLVRIPNGSARTIVQGLLAVLFVAVEDLVAGLARYAEFTAQARHRLSFQQPADKTQAFLQALQ